MDVVWSKHREPAANRGSKFTKAFVARLKERGVRANSLPKASPNLNGRCERIIGIIKWKCLNKFIIFGKRHLDYLVSEFVDYYKNHRSHMERDWLPPVRIPSRAVQSLGELIPFCNPPFSAAYISRSKTLVDEFAVIGVLGLIAWAAFRHGKHLGSRKGFWAGRHIRRR